MTQFITTLTAAVALSTSLQAGITTSGGLGKGQLPPPPPGCPCEIAYNYVQAFYGHGEFDDGSSNGVNAQISYSPVEHFFLTAGGGWDAVSAGFGDFDDYTLHAGFGGWIPLLPCVHLGIEVGGSYNATNGFGEDFGDGDFSGYAKPHVRFCAGKVEGKLGIEFTTADVDTQWIAQTEMIFKVLGPSADLAMGVDFNEDVQFYNAGVRFRF